MILIYPVISMGPFSHSGSRSALLGRNTSQDLVDKFSNEKQVDSNTPPTFLVHATDDKTVPVENSISFYLACKKAHVPAEMHIWQKGEHGFGLGKSGTPVSRWPALCATGWIKWAFAANKNPAFKFPRQLGIYSERIRFFKGRVGLRSRNTHILRDL